jgi:hypothetical protein
MAKSVLSSPMTLDAALFCPRPELARQSDLLPTHLDRSLIPTFSAFPPPSSLTLCSLLHSCAKERTTSPLFSIISALFAKTPGCYQERFLSPLVSRDSPLTALDATLTADLRVLTEISRNCPPASPLDATLAGTSAVTPLEATLTKMRGGGWGKAAGTGSVLSATSFTSFHCAKLVSLCPLN